MEDRKKERRLPTLRELCYPDPRPQVYPLQPGDIGTFYIPPIQELFDIVNSRSQRQHPPRVYRPPSYRKTDRPKHSRRHSSTRQKRKPLYVGGLPLKTYRLDNVPFTMQRPDNEEINSVTRKTIDGRTLTYVLNVLQQPERARACGAGARSSADRRPVDPPPVVELRIIEGVGEKTNDITLAYNASFFLFATLEVARPIAGGRMHSAPVIPVLTGVPVAGTNYLDRPAPAGYFIFPDLSVRHEGFYRLVFNLYEATKEPEDADIDRPFTPASPADSTSDRAPLLHENMALRLDVRSSPFQVYSAKKFPGLSESTQLSRLVADQGCRVRIRRDVRMRKRGEGRKDEFDSFDEGQRSVDRFATPDSAYPPQTPIEPPRSISRTSMDSSQYSGDHYHRSSLDSGFPSHGYHSSMNPMSAHSAHSSSSYTMQGPSPTTPSAPTNSHYSAYQSAPAPAPVAQGFTVPRPPHRLSHDRNTEAPQYAPAHRSSENNQYWNKLPNPLGTRRSVTPDVPTQKAALPATLPSIRSLSDATNRGIGDLTNVSSPTGTFDYGRKQWNMPESSLAGKRSYSPQASHAYQQPLKGGMRPDSVQSLTSWSNTSIEPDRNPYREEEEDELDDSNTMSLMMRYRRADGKMSKKHVPYNDSNLR